MRILTFDIEDWFHLLDNDSTRTVNDWHRYSSRIHQEIELIFSILEKSGTRATFFCLGWMAEQHPGIIREIAARGYEIGSHTHLHQLLYELTPDTFRHDLHRSIQTIQDVTGEKVKYFRAPGFSIKKSNLWALEVIASEGIEVDCSIFPAQHAHGGFPDFGSNQPAVINYKGINLKELPMNYMKILHKHIVFSGGGYFRLLPYHLIRHWTEQSDYVMAYHHPRDFDGNQPVLKGLPIKRRFKSYVGLKGASSKLERWLKDFDFTDIGNAVRLIEWDQAPVINILHED